MPKKIMVTGGAGYVGCVLVPKLLAAGHMVVVYDLMLFGSDGLPKHERLAVVEGDLRNMAHFSNHLTDVDCVIHLACISNDPSFELDSALSKSINYDCFGPMVEGCKRQGVRRFIYASTSSVYGVSDAPEVTEEHPLVPLTDYNKYKGLCEPILLRRKSNDFVVVIIRPATVCGYSPRMRLDLTVNILTNYAYNKGEITVFGGNQKRPNIHIEDVTDLYVSLVDVPSNLINGQTFNAGFENHTVSEIASEVKSVVEKEMPGLAPIHIVTTPSDDLRSYHITSKKIRDLLGYVPRRTIGQAARDICLAFEEGKLPNGMIDDRYFNVNTIKKLRLK